MFYTPVFVPCNFVNNNENNTTLIRDELGLNNKSLVGGYIVVLVS